MTAAYRAAVVVLAALSPLASGCGTGPVNLGPGPDMLWWSDHETGDQLDWTRDSEGSEFESCAGNLSVVTDHARSGRYALRSVVEDPAHVSTPCIPLLSSAAAYRAGLMNADAYYSAWYFVPSTLIPATTSYWVFTKFRSLTRAGGQAEAWDLDFRAPNGGAPVFTLFHHTDLVDPTKGLDEPSPNPVAVPIDRWFQIEAYLRPENDNTGRLTFWLDGSVSFDVKDRPTMPTRYVEWSVGGITAMIAPSPATFYIDDAAISTRRLGPDYPVFWRGEAIP